MENHAGTNTKRVGSPPSQVLKVADRVKVIHLGCQEAHELLNVSGGDEPDGSGVRVMVCRQRGSHGVDARIQLLESLEPSKGPVQRRDHTDSSAVVIGNKQFLLPMLAILLGSETDPNFGNYRIIIDQEGQNDKIGLLDFGAVHSLADEFTAALKKTILAAHSRDIEAIVEGAIDLGCLRPSDTLVVKESFADFCCFILEPFSSDLSKLPAFTLTEQGLYDWRASRLLKRAGKLGSEGMLVKGFVIPPAEFMLMARKLTGVFTFVSALGAELDSSFLLESYKG